MTGFKSHDFRSLSSKEWIVTNGIGGYASSTVTGTNTRRYHGLLVASFNPPTERKVVVSKVDEAVIIGGQRYPLSTSQYKDTIAPEGYRHITGFKRSPLPETQFQAGGARLTKSVFMVYNSNTTVVEYQNSGTETFNLWLNPLYTGRDYHTLQYENGEQEYQLQLREGHQVIRISHQMPHFYFRHTAGEFKEGRTWHKNLLYNIELSRGQDHTEDLYSTGVVEHELKPGEKLHLIFTFEEMMVSADPERLKEVEMARLAKLSPNDGGFLSDLLVCGEQFIVHRKSTANYSIIAGYHWFTDWGRDSMIALRGLCIATGRRKEAASVITTFLEYLNEGIIPNRFPDSANDAPEYHTIDATLWLFVAVYEYDLKFKDDEFLKKVFPKLSEIIGHHIKGTKHNIHINANGLLFGGTPGLPLTWMDARIENHAFTPRRGCPVEINALWFNALKIYAHVAERTGNIPDPAIADLAEKCRVEFTRSFWNHNGFLNDTITSTYQIDTSFRPNQVYAVSLPFSILSPEKEKELIENVKKELLTPYGLRTLERGHPDFRPTYEGDVWRRDESYHQGTVWPFLLPEYHEAFLKVNGYSEEAKKEVSQQLAALKEHFYENECIHGISEIFDGLNPSEGKGCMNQAWSVSNLILLVMKHGLTV